MISDLTHFFQTFYNRFFHFPWNVFSYPPCDWSQPLCPCELCSFPFTCVFLSHDHAVKRSHDIVLWSLWSDFYSIGDIHTLLSFTFEPPFPPFPPPQTPYQYQNPNWHTWMWHWCDLSCVMVNQVCGLWPGVWGLGHCGILHWGVQVQIPSISSKGIPNTKEMCCLWSLYDGGGDWYQGGLLCVAWIIHCWQPTENPSKGISWCMTSGSLGMLTGRGKYTPQWSSRMLSQSNPG